MSTNFTATPAELSLVSQIFAQADKQKLGILSGDVAVKVFGGAKLPGSVLGEIWSIADEENNGWLSKTGAAKALRLIAHAQKGEKVSTTLLSKPGPLPNIEGYSVTQQHSTGASIPRSPPPGFPPLSPQDKIKFQNIFNRSGPVNGLLNGEKARDIFLKSKLSNDQLLQIWNLADTRDRGVLDVTDFTIAMYFIQGLMAQHISFVPTTLPPGLYEQAGGLSSNVPSSIITHMSGNSGSLSPVSGTFGRVQPQYTGPSQPFTPDHGLSPQPRAPALPARPAVAAFRPVSVAQGNGHDTWDVNPTEKAEADAIFDSELDIKKVGYVEGEAAVPFMLRSQLPGEDLAQIWDLADINSDGRLTRDGFAIAYHLIKKKLSGQPIPAQLPPSLIPPLLRPQASFFQAPPRPQPEPPRDLLDFDDTPPASAVSPQATGTLSVLQPQSSGATAVPPVPSRNNINDPFASSPFASSSFAPASDNDLLGNHEDRSQTTSPLQDKSAELGNVKNQLQSTNRSLDAAKAERAKLESTLASQAAELSALQTQLSSAKAAYDTETTLLAQLKERYTTQSSEIQKSREELIRSESDLSAIRVEKAEIEQAFLRDKEEARDLHRRMIEAGQQADQLKAEVEKAKKEAKQQKGRLAIARKQLLTKEAEKVKAEKELDEADAEVKSTIQEAEEAEIQLAGSIEQPQPKRATSPDSIAVAAAQPLPASPEPISSSKSNNPFERLAMSSGSPSPRSQSPFLPFSNVALTSPPIGPTEGQNGQTNPDPKPSFDEFFGVKEPTEEPKPAQVNGDSAPQEMNFATPVSPNTATDTEHFVTPPTTANNETRSESLENFASSATDGFPSVDDAVAQFPPAEDTADGGMEKKQDNERTTTDLGTKLQELEVEESDSDESDDDDNEPLSEVVQKVKEKVNMADHSPKVDATPALAPNVAATVQSKSSFDDIFESNNTPVPPAIPLSEVPKSMPSPFDISTDVQPPEPAKPNTTAGVNAFDETLSGFSPPPSAAPAQFTFDAFEDSFDFGAAGAAVPTAAPVAQTTNAAPAPSFDDIFASSNVAAAVQPQAVSASMTNGTTLQVEPTKPTSFDDAFATFDANPNLNLESSFLSTTSANLNNVNPTDAQASKPFPSSSGPASPKTVDTSSPRPSMNRASSPTPRSASPPVRMTSPAPRASTSSKDGHEKLKEAPTRHSKLSIRFPFGKRKNKNNHPEPMPPPPSMLSPPREDSNRAITPASDDDVEAVKQITAMGFSRSQAVEALEKYGYDVQRAINSLL